MYSSHYTLGLVLHNRSVALFGSIIHSLSDKSMLNKIRATYQRENVQNDLVAADLQEFLKKADESHWQYASACYLLSTNWFCRFAQNVEGGKEMVIVLTIECIDIIYIRIFVRACVCVCVCVRVCVLAATKNTETSDKPQLRIKAAA